MRGPVKSPPNLTLFLNATFQYSTGQKFMECTLCLIFSQCSTPMGDSNTHREDRRGVHQPHMTYGSQQCCAEWILCRFSISFCPKLYTSSSIQYYHPLVALAFLVSLHKSSLKHHESKKNQSQIQPNPESKMLPNYSQNCWQIKSQECSTQQNALVLYHE